MSSLCLRRPQFHKNRLTNGSLTYTRKIVNLNNFQHIPFKMAKLIYTSYRIEYLTLPITKLNIISYQIEYLTKLNILQND